MRGMDDALATDIAQAALPPAPGADRYRSLDFADTAATLPAGQSYDLLATPESAMHWLAAHDLTTPDVQLYEVCAQRMRTLRAHVRALFAARVDSTTPPEESLRAVNEALMAVPTAPSSPGTGPRDCAASRHTPPTGPSTTHWRPSPPTPPTCSPVPTPASSPPAAPPPATGSSCAPTAGATGALPAAATASAPPAPTPGAAAPRADAPPRAPSRPTPRTAG